MVERLTYRVPEVAEMLGISASAAYMYVQRGVLPSVRLQGSVLVLKSDLEAFLAQHRTGGDISIEKQKKDTSADPASLRPGM